MHNNIYRRTIKVMSFIALGGLILLISPWLFNIDIMSGGAAMIMIGLLLTITGVMSIFLYNRQSRAVDNIFSGKDLLAKWELSTKEWEDFFPRAKKAMGSQKFMLWGTMTLFFLLFAGVFYFVMDDRKDAQFFFLIMGIIWLFISVLIYVLQKNNKTNPKNREVYIGTKGVYVNGKAHLWKGVGTSLVDVEYLEDDQLLKFTYSSPIAYIPQPQNILVFVPIGNRDKSLNKVLDYFNLDRIEPQDEPSSDQNYFETEL